jgi:hypothetical protein
LAQIPYTFADAIGRPPKLAPSSKIGPSHPSRSANHAPSNRCRRSHPTHPVCPCSSLSRF